MGSILSGCQLGVGWGMEKPLLDSFLFHRVAFV
jgi:hypothetical protein